MKSLTKKIISHFARGLLALLPLFITLTIVMALFHFVERQVETITQWVPAQYQAIASLKLVIELSTAIILFAAIAIFGLTVKTLWGKLIVRKLDQFLAAIPGISAIYKATRQVIDILTMGKNKDIMKPVLIEYPSANSWAVAFTTGEALAHLSPKKSTEKHYTVFIPTTPNPTGGFLLILPESKIQPLNIPFEAAIKLILTGGMVKEGT